MPTSSLSTGVSPLAGPKLNFEMGRDPINTDDITEGYLEGATWLNTSTNVSFVCVDNTESLAVWEQNTGWLKQQAGRIEAIEFVGNPKTATVTMPDSFEDENYTVAFTPSVTAGSAGTWCYSLVGDQLANEFTVSMGANNINELVFLAYTATKHGSSA